MPQTQRPSEATNGTVHTLITIRETGTRDELAAVVEQDKQDLVDRLRDAREAIRSLPEESLGYDADEDPDGVPVATWPIQAELLSRIDEALNRHTPQQQVGIL